MDKSTNLRSFAVTTIALSFLLSISAPAQVRAIDAASQSNVPSSTVIPANPSIEDDTNSVAPDVATTELEGDDGGANPAATLLIDTNRKLRPGSSSLPAKSQSLVTAKRDASGIKYKAGIPCVPLMLVDDPSTLIVSDREASIKAENRVITLTHGKGIYMVGKHPITVETPLANISLAGNSAAIIEQSDNGFLRVDHLTGAASSVVAKKWKGTRVFSAAQGEEICLIPRSVSNDELVPRDGVLREEIATEVNDDGEKFVSNKFVPKNMIEQECLLQCDANSFFQVRRKVYQLRNSINEQDNGVSIASNKQANSNDNAQVLIEGRDVIPVNFSEPSVQMPVLRTANTSSALIKFSGNSDIRFDHPVITELKSGEALVSANDTTFVKTPGSMVKIEPGTLALISVSNNVTKVRNLWENERHGVCQTIAGLPFYVVAGDESLTGSDLRSVYLTASKDMIGRRLTHFTELPDGGVVHFAEVSLMSLAQNDDLLLQLMNSNDPIDKSLNRKLNKMAAILVQISASHGLYELMQPPQWKRDSKSSSLAPTLN